MSYIQKRFDCHLIKIRILKFFFQIFSMIKPSCKRNFRVRLRIKSFIHGSFFQQFFSYPLSFFLLLASLGFLFQVLSLSLRRGINNSFWMFQFILVSLTFLKSFCLLYLHKRISLLKEYIILPIVLFFLGVHFYILLFALDSKLDFGLFNSIFIWRYALKTVRGIASKILIIFPFLALLTWKLSLFDSKIQDFVLFFGSAVLVLSKKCLFKKESLVSESLKKSPSDLEKKEQLEVLESLQEAVLLFTPALKLHYSNPYLSRMILSASSLISPSQLESEVLSIRQDDKYVQLKGLALRNESEFLHLIKALKSKMTLFTNSLTEFNEESNTSYFSRKTVKSVLTFQKRKRKSRETRKSKVESLSKVKDSNKEISVKEFEKIKLKGLHFLNKNNQIYQQKSLKTLPETKTLSEILRSFLDHKHPNCHFFAQAKEPGKILLVSMETIETGVLVLIKCIDRKDPLLTIWDNYEVQNKLLASMCHELRTPLNSITNMLELMDGCEEENESQNYSQREYLSAAILNSKLLMSNINDFLDYFSLGSRMFELHCKAFDIQKLLIECEIIFRPFALRKVVNFFLHIPEADNFICRNDEERTKQIIFNLLNNAFKFTASTGTILIQLKIREEYFEIMVQDTGTGIEPERLKTLGNFKANSLNGLSVLGGFGLAISNHLANYVGPKEERGNGYRGIKVRTEKDKGSRFSFLVDKNKKRTEELESLAEETYAIEKKSRNIEHFTQTHRSDFRFLNPEDKTGEFSQVPEQVVKCECRKILAVDDNDFNLFVLREHFKKKNFEIDTCSGGVEAVTLVEEILLIDTSIRFCNKCRFYKLILMDIDMPIKNGYETTKEIRMLLLDSGIDVNIVALSAFCQEEAKEKAYGAGIEDYIEKPFSLAKMEYLIDTYL